MWTYETYDEIYHHGIKGQKWGVRRYQNPDGTLTNEGKRRQKISNGLMTAVGGIVGAKAGKNVAQKAALKSGSFNKIRLRREMGKHLDDYYYYRGANAAWKDIKANLHLKNPELFDKRYEGFVKGEMLRSDAGFNLMKSTTKELGRLLTVYGITGAAVGALSISAVTLGSIYVANKIKSNRTKQDKE